MIPDKTRHQQHANSTELETIHSTDHPVLTSLTVAACPHGDCRYREVRDYEIGHNFGPPFNLQERLATLKEEITLPVIHTYHTAGGHREGRKAFQTRAEAEAYIFGRYGGNGNRPATGSTIRKTYSRSSGSHSQVAHEKSYPMVCAIADTYQNKPVYSNLVPRKKDIPETAPQWQNSVEAKVAAHLNPAEHIVSSKLGEDDEFARTPDNYDHAALSWHVEQVRYWDVRVQTPELFLGAEDLNVGAEHADGYETPAPA